MLKHKPISLICANCNSHDLEVSYSLEPHEINIVCRNCGTITQIAVLPTDVDSTCSKILINDKCNIAYIDKDFNKKIAPKLADLKAKKG